MSKGLTPTATKLAEKGRIKMFAIIVATLCACAIGLYATETSSGLLPSASTEPSAWVVITSDGPIEVYATPHPAEEHAAELMEVGTLATVMPVVPAYQCDEGVE